MGKKQAKTNKAKTTGRTKSAQLTPAQTKARVTTSKGKPTASKGKAAKPPKSKATKPAAEPTTFDSEMYGKIKALLDDLSSKDLRNLWFSAYGYGDEVTKKDVPKERDDIISDLADMAYTLQPTPDEMTPKKLADLLDEAS
jgi:hypothetical protein